MRGATALALALALGAVSSPSAGGALIAAHRGGAALWPENSLLAFRNALAAGADLVEFDVHLSADGEVIVIHDATLERTTTGRGAVRGVRAAEIATLYLRDRDGSRTDERVPTLEALLALVAPSRAEMLLEIKVGPDGGRYAGIEDGVLRRLREAGLLARTIVMAFEPATLVSVRALAPEARTCLLIARAQRWRLSAAELVRRATDLGVSHLGLEHRLVTADVVAAAHRANLRVAAWTVNDEADIRRVLDLGVDVVISDRPDRARRLAR